MVDKITLPITQTGVINKINEIIDSPASIVVDTTISSTSENPVQNKVIYAALTAKADTTAIPSKTSDLTNDSGFIQTIKVNGTAQPVSTSTVSLTIPETQTVGDAYLTIKRNGTAIGSFSANATSAVNIDITVPTQASDVGALPSDTVIGDGQIVFTQGGTAKGTISANQTSTMTIDFEGTSSITIDTTLSTTSTNPVENRVITSAVQSKTTVIFRDWS